MNWRAAPARVLGMVLGLVLATVQGAWGQCSKTVYLSFDTGHMGVALAVAAALDRQQIPASFFLAAEPTLDGGHSLDAQWAPYWRTLSASGRHDFGSHTWAHDIWEADLPNGAMRFRMQAGRQAPRWRELDGPAYCAELERVAVRFREMTGQTLSRIYRAPAGRTSPRLLAATKACAWHHVGWDLALGDDWPSSRASNPQLLQRALKGARDGDILLAHLGIWSRQPALLPELLAPLLDGLKAKGFCFGRLREHPQHAAAFR
ncbi:peptidoglycan/xylan/chitin deacetylase (PgdA/CDA1 family) [Inhella inkyongensis]|uniref:Peptidoglycan/xylan/chitin deacetylase (PgdA/CDA1 family) n=1 Tax=Inhella inkyongensis TaxID=392593 RepID=A0A840S4C8_9BURK|nr:polysaccharide deacetylase family protein [Inhella inkyongensis]MBB5203674.1 peptidoglycan/xylan/chitin deacetylase (PgdA/CDA1 family) [Inhella inkyongensis]